MAKEIDIEVFEFQIPKKYGSVVFFKDKETMEKWCKKWKCYVPIVGNGVDPQAEKILPGVFAALREKADYGLG